MQFLKILFWCLLSFVVAIFTYGNWSWVSINLWGGLIAEVNLPFLMVLMFLCGMVPTWLYYRRTRYLLSKRLFAAERVIADLKPVVPMGTDPGTEPPAATPIPAKPVQPPLELEP